MDERATDGVVALRAVVGVWAIIARGCVVALRVVISGDAVRDAIVGTVVPARAGSVAAARPTISGVAAARGVVVVVTGVAAVRTFVVPPTARVFCGGVANAGTQNKAATKTVNIFVIFLSVHFILIVNFRQENNRLDMKTIVIFILIIS